MDPASGTCGSHMMNPDKFLTCGVFQRSSRDNIRIQKTAFSFVLGPYLYFSPLHEHVEVAGDLKVSGYLLLLIVSVAGQ